MCIDDWKNRYIAKCNTIDFYFIRIEKMVEVYQTANNVSSTLTNSIWTATTSIAVNDISIFPTSFPFICTIEHFDEDWNCTTREIVKVTWSNTSTWTLTIQRAVEQCVSNDTVSPKVMQQDAHIFYAWDVIGMTATAWLIWNLYWIADEVNALSDDVQEILDFIS